MLYARCLTWEADTYTPNRPPTATPPPELERETRSLIEGMIAQVPQWGDHYACFAILTSLLLFLYRRALQTLDPQALKSLLDANGHSPTDQHHHHQDVEVAKAVAGVNFTVRIIADTTSDYNEYLSHRPERLAPCPPVTPFSAYQCLKTLNEYESIIPDADRRFHDIYSSLHFFAKRWGVGGEYPCARTLRQV